MQDLNTIPSVGTFGEVARNANTNFSLLKIAVDLLEHSIEHSRGYFTSASALTTAFPSPVVGDWAIVEVSGTPTIYKCSTRGTWSNSGTPWAGGSVDLTEYAQKTELYNSGYYICETAAGTAAKTVSASGYLLKQGGNIRIRMSYANTAANATLNIGGTGAKPLFYNDARASASNSWEAEETIVVYYDGTNYIASNAKGGGGKFATGEAVGSVGIDDSPLPDSNNLIKSASVYDGFVGVGTTIGTNKEKETGWIVGTINTKNGANANSQTRIRSGFIEVNRGELTVGCTAGYYVLAVLAYNSYGFDDYDGVLYMDNGQHTSARVNINSSIFVRAVVAKVNGGNMSVSDGDNVSIRCNVELEQSICESIEELKSNDSQQDERIGIIEVKLNGGGGDETVIPLVRNGYWNIGEWKWMESVGYSYSQPFAVTYGQELKVRINTGAGAYGVYGAETNIFARGGVILVTNNTSGEFTVTIPMGVNYIFISSRNEDFNTPYTPSASIIQTSWIEEKIESVIELKALKNRFAGLKLVTLGDSITQGQVMNGTAPSKPFPVLVAEKLGMTLVNYGIGGSTIGTCANYGGTFASMADFNAATKNTSKYYVVMTGNQTYADYKYNGSSWVTTSVAMRTPLVDRYNLMDDDADIIIVAGGTNDFQYNWADIGEVSDVSSLTFRGALNNLCSGLIAKYPEKCIIFMTPIKRCQTQQATAANSDTNAHRGGSYGTIDSQNAIGKTLKDYGDIIKEMCARYSIPVIDMYAESMLNPHLSSQSSLFDSYKTHPYQAGHDMMARLIVGKLISIFG